MSRVTHPARHTHVLVGPLGASSPSPLHLAGCWHWLLCIVGVETPPPVDPAPDLPLPLLLLSGTDSPRPWAGFVYCDVPSSCSCFALEKNTWSFPLSWHSSDLIMNGSHFRWANTGSCSLYSSLIAKNLQDVEEKVKLREINAVVKLQVQGLCVDAVLSASDKLSWPSEL